MITPSVRSINSLMRLVSIRMHHKTQTMVVGSQNLFLITISGWLLPGARARGICKTILLLSIASDAMFSYVAIALQVMPAAAVQLLQKDILSCAGVSNPHCIPLLGCTPVDLCCSLAVIVLCQQRPTSDSIKATRKD